MANDPAFQKILAAVDGSEHGVRAAEVGGRLAAATGGQLTIVSVYHEPPSALGEPEYSKRLIPAMQAARDALKAARDAVVAAGGAEPETMHIAGTPAAKIVELVQARGYDVIVMGSRGHGRLASAVLGSVSMEVSASAHVPVMVVPHTAG